MLINKNQFILKEGAKDKLVVKAKYDNSEKDITEQVSFWINDGRVAEIQVTEKLEDLNRDKQLLWLITKIMRCVFQYILKMD